MTETAPLLTEARALIDAGRFAEAVALLEPIFIDVADAAFLAGIAANRAGDLVQSSEFFERASELAPRDASVKLNLGLTLRALSRDDDAESALREALEIDPDLQAAHFALGNLHMQKGEFAAAVDSFGAVLRSDPDHLGAHNNKGICETRLGQLEAAAESFAFVIALDDQNFGAMANLGAIYAEQGHTDQAIEYYQQALLLAPEQMETANNLGVALLDKGRAGDAVQTLRPLTESGRAGAEIFSNLGNALVKLGDTRGAATAYEQSLAIQPDDGVRLKRALILPIVSQTASAMSDALAAYEAAIDQLITDPPTLTDPFAQVGIPSFNLSYHDTNNRDVLGKLADMYRQACPALEFVAPHCKRARAKGDPVRIGFVSRFFQSNSVGRCFHGVLRFHGRADVSVTAFTFSAEPDPLWQAIADDVDQAIILPAHLDAARQRIAAAELDVLIYTDIGMDPLTYFLAFSRLAPLQCVLGGHPDAVSIPAIDAYVSSDMQEPGDAEAHYASELIRLPGAPTYYERPDLPSPLKPREVFGLPDGVAVYFCGQTLIKVHPEMDALFAGILARDPCGVIVLPEGYTPELALLLKERFRRTIPGADTRILFLPAMSHMDYMNVMALADVSLDTRPFGGGNTSWQAIAVGTPMISWPGRYLRGRYTQALYRLMEVEGAIAGSAEEYIELAVKFATDPIHRAAFNAEVATKAESIFVDRTHVESLYRFLVDRFKSAL